MAEVTKKYRIQQKDANGDIITLHPETEAVITLVKPFDDISATNTQVALKQLNDKIDSTKENAVISKTKEEWWNLNPTTQPNTIYVYTDYRRLEDGKLVAGIKIGDGVTKLNNKAFITDYLAYSLAELDSRFDAHYNDNVRHITQAERVDWNNKITCDDDITNETLIFTRD